MKGNGFGDKARRLGEWFQDWNSCEQTIALYSLLSKVSATQARFLSLVLEHSLKNGCDSQELSKLETRANSSSYLKSLHSNTEEEALCQLLSHLPLLNPGNTEARSEYMKLLPKVMLGSSDEIDYIDQCRQLLSLALVHPAFPHEDREALTFWLSQLDTKHKCIAERQGMNSFPSQRPPPIPPRIRQIRNLDECSSSPTNGRIYIEGDLNHTLHNQDTPSYTSDPYNADDEEVQRTLGFSNTLPRQAPPISFGSIDHSSSFPSSFEEGMVFRERSSTVPRMASSKDPKSTIEYEPGMKDVPMWLKSLRLHKYQYLFNDLTYKEMLNLKEEYLQVKQVTKGARNKLILCIRKLAQRPETLLEIEQDMEKHGHLLHCFNELRLMLQTPIKPYTAAEHAHTMKTAQLKPVDETSGSCDEDEEGTGDRPRSPTSSPQAHHSSSDCGSDLEELLTKDFPEEDLASLITRAMGKGFSQLMLHTDTNEENLGAFIKLLDTALQHEVFTLDQKKLYFDWKQQCNQTLRIISSKKNSRGGRHYGSAYTMPATPRGLPGSAYPPGSMGINNKGRSLRGVVTRNGSCVMGKGIPLPGSTRTSSTLPRMSARQLQQPIPHNVPSFLRPNSTINFSSPIPISSGHHGESFQTTHTTVSSTSSLVTAPPPLPPRSYDVSEMYMDELCKSVTDHVLPDDLSDN